jgi:DMSO/TMAO reductase YedYZ molybdopterin-dependent catalytic subunit
MNKNRRQFLQKSVLGLIGTPIVFAKNLPAEIKILGENAFELPEGKHKELITLSDRPLNLETPAHLLNDTITPADKMFVRNNGTIPEITDTKDWKLVIGGESVLNEKSYTLQDLKTKFKKYTYQITLECGGNGRSGFMPVASGNQWAEGAVSCAEWSGVRLKDVLNDAGIKNDAVYIGYYGKDRHLSGDTSLAPISRGMPIKKALEDETLLAFEMNGKEIPLLHGFPLRLVVGGYPASVSGKWLEKIVVRNKVHDGEKMNDYRVPKFAIEPGSKPEKDNLMQIIESMPVKSLISYPKSGATLDIGSKLQVNGHAWAGDLKVNEVWVSIDFGATWQKVNLENPKNRFAWQNWSAELNFPQKGYYEIWARATDQRGISQPMVIPAWNPKGYLNNSCHRIAVKVV